MRHEFCPPCGIHTPHILGLVNVTGVKLLCIICGKVTRRISHEEMAQELRGLLRSEPPAEISIDDANTVKVFVQHHLGEAEASLESVQEHIRITGKHPIAGGSLYAYPQGMNHKAFAVPIAKVLRVENVL